MHIPIPNNSKKGFTFVEIMIVVGLITILLAIGIGSYSAIQRGARDDRRKADLEEIRSALEMYRSNNNAYPTPLPSPSPGLPFGLALLDGTNTYLQTIPQDPRNPARIYYYAQSGSDYTLATQLEGVSSCTTPPGGNSCGTGLTCNYCLGSYGQK